MPPPGPVGAVPPPQGVTPNFENPEDVLHTINLASQILSMVIMTPFIIMRVYVKIRVAPPFLLDDWACCIAWVLAEGYSVTALMMNHFGGGFHAWDLTAQDYEGFLKALYADTLVYGPNAWFTKFALLLVIARVFGTFRATRISAWVIMVAMLCYYVPVFIIKIQVCRPINSYWDLGVKGVNVVSQRSLFVADTVMSTVSDIAVLLLPVPAIVSLRMNMAQKLKIWCMLGLGGIATMASIVRMVIVMKLQKSNDQSVDFVRFNLLGTAEVTIGVVCACLPALNILVARHRISSRESSEHSQSKFVSALKSIKFLHGSKLKTAPPITPLRVTNVVTNRKQNDCPSLGQNNHCNSSNDNEFELR
ncbi:hypothetical protein PG995_012908 [Apiospora arundinis]